MASTVAAGSGAKVPPLIREFVQSLDDKEWQSALFGLLQSQVFRLILIFKKNQLLTFIHFRRITSAKWICLNCCAKFWTRTFLRKWTGHGTLTTLRILRYVSCERERVLKKNESWSLCMCVCVLTLENVVYLE